MLFQNEDFPSTRKIQERHGKQLDESTIIALRMVKDELCRVGGELKFPLTKQLRTSVGNASTKYFADLKEQQLAKEKEEARLAAEKAVAVKLQAQQAELDNVNFELECLNNQLQAVNEIIADGNTQLGNELLRRSSDINVIQAAHSKISIGLERKTKIEDHVVELNNKKLKVQK